MARKPRDYDAELQALMDRAKKLKNQKTVQLGELVQVTGADSLPMEALAGALLAAVEQSRSHPKPSRGGPNAARPSFSKTARASGAARQVPPNLLADMQATTARLRRLVVVRNRLDAARARTDTRDWAKARRERTRHLIELGGLVIKADLVELLDDDRATLLGALLDLAGQLRGMDGDDPPHLRARWRRAGLRAFAAERDAANGEQGQEEGETARESAALPHPGSPAP